MSTPARKRDLDAAATREALLESGRRLFLQGGYAAVSAEALVRSAGLTRGALYHHFDGKKGLFRELVAALQDDAAALVGRAMSQASDPWDAASNGARAFLELTTETAYRELVLIQAPLVLGWALWRELDEERLGSLVVTGIRALRDAGRLSPLPEQLVATGLYGALTELSLVVAADPYPHVALERAHRVFMAMLGGLGSS
ncbi:helix-turn-helix domain-containing protein [Intrasporangium sp. DVR]|uniref:TetR/AcrR family transcriptional regulator n=1 Tax=Intrasporangium sp. DVR TaxID=3127867 RepID=UPI00313A612E